MENNQFSQLSLLYFEPNGQLKKDASLTFFRSLPLTSILCFEPRELQTLFINWYGPDIHWELLSPGSFTGRSNDPVIKISTKNEVYFFKRFLRSEQALKEYLGYLYTTELNLPYWKHVPIVKIGRLQQLNGQEQIYLVTKSAQGLQPFRYFQNSSDLASSETTLQTLAKALSDMHARDSYLFSEEEAYARIPPTFTTPHLQKKLQSHPSLHTFYQNFQTRLNTFTKNPPRGALSISPDFYFTNCAFLPSNTYLECFDQGYIINFFTPKGKCFLFPEQIVATTVLSLSRLSLQKLFSRKLARHLATTFLTTYYNNTSNVLDLFYEHADFWIHHALIHGLDTGFSNHDDSLITSLHKFILQYSKNPKKFIAGLL